MKYTIYATADYGDGRVQEIGRVDDIREYEIIVGMFSKDVVITIEEDFESKEEDEE